MSNPVAATSVEQMFINHTRAELLKEPQDTSRLRLRRVKRFMGSMGLRVCDFRLPPLERAPWVNMKASTLFQPVHDVWGFYQPKIDLAVVYRNHEVEQLNGCGWTEAILVHELAHGSGKVVGRSFGFMPAHQDGSRRGTFFEEGFAESMSGRYIRDALGLRAGFDQKNNGPMETKESNGHTLALSNVYCFAESEATYAWSISSLAAMAIDALTDAQDGLWATMLASRQDETHLAAVRQRVNSIHPGLYDDLHSIDNSAEFAAGLHLVQEVLG